jgi:hypothetical protein
VVKYDALARNALEAGNQQLFAAELQAADAVVLALLLTNSSGAMVQYSGSTLELSKPQVASLRKAKRHAKSRVSGGGRGAESGAEAAALAVAAAALEVVVRPVGVGVLCLDSSSHQHCSIGSIWAGPDAASQQAQASAMWFLPLDVAAAGGSCRTAAQAPPGVAQLLAQLVSDASRPAICCNAKDVLCQLSRWGSGAGPCAW